MNGVSNDDSNLVSIFTMLTGLFFYPFLLIKEKSHKFFEF